MFPFSNLHKKYSDLELLQVAIGKYNIQLNSTNFQISITGNFTINTQPNLVYNSENYLNSDFNPLLSLIGLKILEIKEFDKTDEYPDGYMIFYFENDIELLVEFAKNFESVNIDVGEFPKNELFVF